MPGFTIGGTGDKHAGNDALDATAEAKRKHRWAFTVFWGGVGDVKKAAVYLQNAQRPHAVIDVPELHHDQEVVYYAGKYHWEALNLVFYDMSGTGGNATDSSDAIYKWFNAVVDIPSATVSLPSSYKKTCELDMTDGSGASVEKWKLYHCWPIDANWNEIDYTNTEIQTIDVQMRFDRAVKATA